MGQVITVLSGKGGTGKTSVCACVATALAELGQRVLCIDCDVGLRNLDISLGISNQGTLNFLDVCRQGYDLALAAEHPDYPNLRFLTAPVNCSAEAVELPAFQAMLRAAREMYDIILLDASAGLEDGFRLTTLDCDRLILVTGPDPAAIRDAGRTAELLELMGKTDLRLIVNRISKRMMRAMGLNVDDIMDQAGLPLLGIIPDDPKVTLAAATGKPLLKYSRRSAAAAACRRIAKRILGKRVPISL